LYIIKQNKEMCVEITLMKRQLVIKKKRKIPHILFCFLQTISRFNGFYLVSFEVFTAVWLILVF